MILHTQKKNLGKKGVRLIHVGGLYNVIYGNSILENMTLQIQAKVG